LHEKISELATRVRELEDALRASHAHLSSEQHPLLSEELLKIKAPLQRDANQAKPSTSAPIKEDEPNPDVVDAFGSLSIGLSGKTKYYGQIANSWVRMRRPEFSKNANLLFNIVLSRSAFERC